jgi:hypothetical protein
MNQRDTFAESRVPKWLGTFTPPAPYRVFRLVAKQDELADRIHTAKAAIDSAAHVTPPTEINMEQSIARNLLQVSLKEFKLATKVFTRKRLQMGPVLLAYEGGYLSIESGEVTVVMHATGEWHGRATFSPQVMRALAMVPPAQNPIPIAYADGHLLIGSMTITCDWNIVGEAFVRDLENPSIIDLLALERTLPRAQIKGSELGKRIRSAQDKTERRIRNAAAQLADLEITEAEIRALVEARIASRMDQ